MSSWLGQIQQAAAAAAEEAGKRAAELQAKAGEVAKSAPAFTHFFDELEKTNVKPKEDDVSHLVRLDFDFEAGSLGFKIEGDCVVFVEPGGQAEGFSVQCGYRVLAVAREPVPKVPDGDDEKLKRIINRMMKEQPRPVRLTFTPPAGEATGSGDAQNGGVPESVAPESAPTESSTQESASPETASPEEAALKPAALDEAAQESAAAKAIAPSSVMLEPVVDEPDALEIDAVESSALEAVVEMAAAAEDIAPTSGATGSIVQESVAPESPSVEVCAQRSAATESLADVSVVLDSVALESAAAEAVGDESVAAEAMGLGPFPSESIVEEPIAPEAVVEMALSAEVIATTFELESIAQEPAALESVVLESDSRPAVVEEFVPAESIRPSFVEPESLAQECVVLETVASESAPQEVEAAEDCAPSPVAAEPATRESVALESVTEQSIGIEPDTSPQYTPEDAVVNTPGPNEFVRVLSKRRQKVDKDGEHWTKNSCASTQEVDEDAAARASSRGSDVNNLRRELLSGELQSSRDAAKHADARALEAEASLREVRVELYDMRGVWTLLEQERHKAEKQEKDDATMRRTQSAIVESLLLCSQKATEEAQTQGQVANLALTALQADMMELRRELDQERENAQMQAAERVEDASRKDMDGERLADLVGELENAKISAEAADARALFKEESFRASLVELEDFRHVRTELEQERLKVEEEEARRSEEASKGLAEYDRSELLERTLVGAEQAAHDAEGRLQASNDSLEVLRAEALRFVASDRSEHLESALVGAQLGAQDAEARFQASNQIVEALHAELADLSEELVRENEESRTMLADKAGRVAVLEGELQEARCEGEAAESHAKMHGQSLSTAQAERAQLEEALQQVEGTLEGLSVQLERRSAEEADMKEAQKVARRERVSEDELREKRDDVLVAELSDLRRVTESTEGRLHTCEHDLSYARSEVEEARSLHSEVHQELVRAGGDLQASVDSHAKEIQTLQTRARSAVQSARQEGNRVVEEVAAQSSKIRDKADSLHAELVDSKAEAKEASSHAAEIEAHLSQVRAELSSAAEGWEKAERKLVESHYECDEMRSAAFQRDERISIAQSMLESRAQSLNYQLVASRDEQDVVSCRSSELVVELEAASLQAVELRTALAYRSEEHETAVAALTSHRGSLEHAIATLEDERSAAEARAQARAEEMALRHRDAEARAAELGALAEQEALNARAALERATSVGERVAAVEAELREEQLRASELAQAQEKMETVRTNVETYRQMIRILQQRLADQERQSENEREEWKQEQLRREQTQSKPDVREARGPELARRGDGEAEGATKPLEASAVVGESDTRREVHGGPPENEAIAGTSVLHERIAVLQKTCEAQQKKLNMRPIVFQASQEDLEDAFQGGASGAAASHSESLIMAVRRRVEATLRSFTRRLLKRDAWLLVFYAHLLVLYTLVAFSQANNTPVGGDCVTDLTLKQGEPLLPAAVAAVAGQPGG